MATSTLYKLVLALNIDNFLSNLKQAQKSSEDSASGIASGFLAVGRTLEDIGTMLVTKVTAPIVALGKEAVTTFAGWESAMSKVQALSGATADELALLEQLTIDLGKSTLYNAEQAAEGLQYMALAGWNTEQMLSALEPVLKLAAAAELDLGRTSDIVTDAMTAFKLEAEQAEWFTDKLAVTMSASNTDLDQLGEAFKYVAPIAGNFGLTVEDTATVLGLLADNGIKGSQAGTTLRRALQNLTAPTEDQAKALSDLNVQIFDSDEQIRSLDDIIRDLSNAFAVLTPEQKANYASTLFGANAYTGLIAVLGTSEERYNELRDAIIDAEGATRDMYDVMTDNLQGSLTTLDSALYELKRSFGALIAEALRPVVDWLTKVVNWFNDLTDEQKRAIIQIAAVAAAIGPLLLVLGKLATAIGFILSHPVIAIIGAVIAAIIWLWNTNEDFRNAVINIWEKIKEGVGNAVNAIKTFFTETLPDAIKVLIKWFQELPGKIWDAITSAVDRVMEWGANIYDAFTTWVSNTIDAVVTWFKELPGKISDAISSAIQRIAEWGSNVKNTFTEWVTNTIQAVQDFFSDLPYKIGYAIGFAITTVAVWAKELHETFATNIAATIEAVFNWFKELPGKIWDAIIDAVTRVKEWSNRVHETMIENVKNTIIAVIDWFKTVPGQIWDAIVSAITRIKEWSNQVHQTMINNVKNTITAVVDWFKTLPSKIYNAIKDAIQKIVQWGRELKEKGKQAGKELVDAVVNTVKAIPGQMLSIGKDIVNGVWTGIKNAKNKFMSDVKGFFSGIVSGAKSALGINSPAKEMIPVGSDTVEGVEVGMEKERDDLMSEVDTLANDIANGFSMDSDINLNTSQNGIAGMFDNVVAAIESAVAALSGVELNVNDYGVTEEQIALGQGSNLNPQNQQPGIYINEIIVRNDDDMQTLSQGLFNFNHNVLRSLGQT